MTPEQFEAKEARIIEIEREKSVLRANINSLERAIGELAAESWKLSCDLIREQEEL